MLPTDDLPRPLHSSVAEPWADDAPGGGPEGVGEADRGSCTRNRSGVDAVATGSSRSHRAPAARSDRRGVFVPAARLLARPEKGFFVAVESGSTDTLEVPG